MKSHEVTKNVTEDPPRKIVINISQQVKDYIDSHGVYGDTPDSILRKLFDLPKKQDKRLKK